MDLQTFNRARAKITESFKARVLATIESIENRIEDGENNFDVEVERCMAERIQTHFLLSAKCEIRELEGEDYKRSVNIHFEVFDKDTLSSIACAEVDISSLILECIEVNNDIQFRIGVTPMSIPGSVLQKVLERRYPFLTCLVSEQIHEGETHLSIYFSFKDSPGLLL